MTATVTKKLMLFFPKCACEKPSIYHLVNCYALIVNIYSAKGTPEEEGYLVLDVTGTEEDIEKGMAFVSTFNVTINTTGKGVTRDEARCTHCGQCVSHCPTGALRIDPGDYRDGSPGAMWLEDGGFPAFLFDIFGLLEEDAAAGDNGASSTLDGVMQLLLEIRQTAREQKDWATSDRIRDALKEVGIVVKDSKEGAAWTKE